MMPHERVEWAVKQLARHHSTARAALLRLGHSEAEVAAAVDPVAALCAVVGTIALRDRLIFDAGFEAARSYGNNAHHYWGEQADRVFAHTMREIDERTFATDPAMKAPPDEPITETQE
jgi:hypothetical protein